MKVRESNPKSNDAQSQLEKGITPLSPEALTQISTQISGKTCRNGSRVGEIEPLEKAGSGSSDRKEITEAGTWTV